MDINLTAVASNVEANSAGSCNPQLHVRDEDAYYAQFGAEWRLLTLARQIVAFVRRMRFAASGASHSDRLAQA